MCCFEARHVSGKDFAQSRAQHSCPRCAGFPSALVNLGLSEHTLLTRGNDGRATPIQSVAHGRRRYSPLNPAYM